MLDNQLIQLFVPIIQQGLIDQGLTNILINQADQPTQQGANSAPTIYFSKLHDEPYGWLKRTDMWDGGSGVQIHSEEQNYLTTFQVNAFVPQDPTNINSLTASDVLKKVRNTLQSDVTRATLKGAEVGMFRIEEMRNPYFKNDKDLFEASPSFDFTLSHKDIIVSTNPIAQAITVNAYEV